MIERATGFYTGAIGNDGTLFNGGFLGEFEDPELGSTILVKTHRPINKADAAVLLIRNPFDAILAEFNRNHGGGHTGHASREDFFDREIWFEKAMDGAQRWRNLYARYVERMPVHLVFFEEMRHDVGECMRGVVKFIGVDIANFEQVRSTDSS